jgi:hypothetical protein
MTGTMRSCKALTFTGNTASMFAPCDVCTIPHVPESNSTTHATWCVRTTLDVQGKCVRTTMMVASEDVRTITSTPRIHTTPSPQARCSVGLHHWQSARICDRATASTNVLWGHAATSRVYSKGAASTPGTFSTIPGLAGRTPAGGNGRGSLKHTADCEAGRRLTFGAVGGVPCGRRPEMFAAVPPRFLPVANAAPHTTLPRMPPPHRRGCWVLSVGGNEMSGGCAGGVFAPVCSVAGGLPRRAGDLQGAGTRPQTGPELRTATPVVGCPRTDTGRMRAGTAEGSLPGRSCQTPPPRRKVGCELPLPIRPWLR